MVDVYTQIRIHAPIGVVSAFAGNPANAPEWYANIISAEWKTPPELKPGSRIAFTARFLGQELRYTYKITSYSAREILVMQTEEGPFPMETTYTWQELEDGYTLMGLRNRGQPRGFSRFISLFMSFAMKRANRKDLLRIKFLIEEGLSDGPDHP
jgi:hypothetical protein